MAHYCTHLCWQRTILHSITAVVRSRKLGRAPILVFLRQALSSHLCQQMVWLLYWLQDRDSMPYQYTINHSTALHTHNEIQWPTATACRWHFALGVVSQRQSCYLSTPSLPWVPCCDHNVCKRVYKVTKYRYNYFRDKIFLLTVKLFTYTEGVHNPLIMVLNWVSLNTTTSLVHFDRTYLDTF